jgi:hypothetical protein
VVVEALRGALKEGPVEQVPEDAVDATFDVAEEIVAEEGAPDEEAFGDNDDVEDGALTLDWETEEVVKAVRGLPDTW